MTLERWVGITACPAYAVSDLGRVQRVKGGNGARLGRILSTSPDDEGYPTVNICGAPRRVHVLVAVAFLGPVPVGGEVHHRNEDKTDPRVVNLEVCATKRDHAAHHRRLRRAGRDPYDPRVDWPERFTEPGRPI